MKRKLYLLLTISCALTRVRIEARLVMGAAELLVTFKFFGTQSTRRCANKEVCEYS